ncbi:MAG: flavin reductase [Ardenticatenaceae bacterium]|nr:flavin reductase [Ardenticatenaceae bacterium]
MINGRDFRNTIGLFATGVTVIVSGDGEEARAMTANAVSSLSMEPMLLMVGVHKKARLAERLQAGHGFSVNILRQEQKDLSNYFAGGWTSDAEPPEFRFVPAPGAPRLDGCLAAIGCKLHELLEGGDHWIAVGEVVDLYRSEETRRPLLFYKGRYRALATDADYTIPVSWDFGW